MKNRVREGMAREGDSRQHAGNDTSPAKPTQRHPRNEYLLAYMDELNITSQRMADIAMCSRSSIEGYRASAGTSRYQVLSKKNLAFIDSMLDASGFLNTSRQQDLKFKVNAQKQQGEAA